jgi:hypothetical protein
MTVSNRALRTASMDVTRFAEVFSFGACVQQAASLPPAAIPGKKEGGRAARIVEQADTHLLPYPVSC